jgi:O-antigen/teichoic acid export membrane protein
MPAQSAEKTLPVSDTAQRASFFRQSGWLMIATVFGGMFMFVVHLLNKYVPSADYAEFGVLLAVTICVPNTPIQMIFAQQTAKAVALNREHQLSGMIRAGWLGIFLFWLAASGVVLIFQHTILSRWQITNPIALYLTLPVVLITAWLPMFWGVLQGRQNFLWLGWSMIVQGPGRLAIAAVAVCLLSLGATGLVTGILGGLVLSLIVAAWATRSLWLAKPVPFDWRGLVKQVLPLLFGFGAYQFLLTADTMFMKVYFDSDTAAPYVGAGTLSRATIWVVGPLAAVMFPKIVHAKAKSENTNIMNTVLMGTLVLAVGGAVGLTVVGPYVVKYIFPTMSAAVIAMLPWYAWAVVPLSLANVLVNNLLARSLTRVVLALVLLAPVYAFALTRFHATPVEVIKVLGAFNTLLFLVCAWYTWSPTHKLADKPAPEPTL